MIRIKSTRGIVRCLIGGLAVIGLYLAFLLALNAGLGRWAVEAFSAFRCEGVAVTPALRVTLRGVSLPLRDARQTRMLTIGRVLIDTPVWEMALRRRVAVHAVEGALSGRDLAVDGMELRCTWPPLIGELRVASARAGPLAVRQVRGPIVQTATRYTVDPLTMQAYSGHLRGTLTIERSPAPRPRRGTQQSWVADGSAERVARGQMALVLRASDLALGDLAPFNAAMFRGARGALHGTLQLRSTSKGLASFEGTFAVEAPGGAIGSAFLQGLLPYLPRTKPCTTWTSCLPARSFLSKRVAQRSTPSVTGLVPKYLPST